LPVNIGSCAEIRIRGLASLTALQALSARSCETTAIRTVSPAGFSTLLELRSTLDSEHALRCKFVFEELLIGSYPPNNLKNTMPNWLYRERRDRLRDYSPRRSLLRFSVAVHILCGRCY